MVASDNDFKTLFLIFEQVLSFWQGNGDEEDVELMFQSAKIVEDTCSEIENIGAINTFESKLKVFWDLKGIKLVPLQFFKKSSYHVLSRYMTDDRFSDSVVDAAVHKFITVRSEKEFQEFAQQLADTNNTVESLKKTLDSTGGVDKYKAANCLEEMRKSVIKSRGDVEEIYSEICKSILNDPNVLRIFLRILSLSGDNEITLYLQEVVALSISDLLRDSANIKLYPHLFDLGVQEFETVITKWHCVIEAVLQTVRVSAKRLKCDYSGNVYSWINTGPDPCLSFDQIVTLFSRCKNLPGINDKMKDFLHQIEDEGFRILTEDIMLGCQIK